MSIVDERNKELEEPRNKSSNIILVNVPQPDGGRDNRVPRDIASLQSISNTLISEDLKIVVHCRLGEVPVPTKIRPLVAIPESKEQRKQLLEKSRSLKNLTPPNLKDIVIVRDLTNQQRREIRKRFEDKQANKPLSSTRRELSPINAVPHPYYFRTARAPKWSLKQLSGVTYTIVWWQL